jgi:hypothetical protein
MADHLHSRAFGNASRAKQTGKGVAQRMEINVPTAFILNGDFGRDQIFLKRGHSRLATKSA